MPPLPRMSAPFLVEFSSSLRTHGHSATGRPQHNHMQPPASTQRYPYLFREMAHVAGVQDRSRGS